MKFIHFSNLINDKNTLVILKFYKICGANFVVSRSILSPEKDRVIISGMDCTTQNVFGSQIVASDITLSLASVKVI